MMLWFGKQYKGCQWRGACDCASLDPARRRCEDCQSYHATDSGYGRCRATPAWTLVPWCRDTCGLYRALKDRCPTCQGSGEVLGPPMVGQPYLRWPRPCPSCGGRTA